MPSPSVSGGGVSTATQYLLPVSSPLPPPQTIISPPVQTALCCARARGVLASSRVGDQEFPAGSKRPPELNTDVSCVTSFKPPHTIISVPVQTAVCWERASGAVASARVGAQESVPGS